MTTRDSRLMAHVIGAVVVVATFLGMGEATIGLFPMWLVLVEAGER